MVNVPTQVEHQALKDRVTALEAQMEAIQVIMTAARAILCPTTP